MNRTHSNRDLPPRVRGLWLLVAALLVGCGPGEPPEVIESEPDSEVATVASDPGDRPIALVTGSTAGLGRALALRLADDGMHVIVHGRDEERGMELVRAIEEEGRGSAHFLAADFASLDEVRALADRIRSDYDRLELLVNNAGVGPGAPGHERVLTPDGNELRFQVNYLAGYLLTRELIPLLEAGAPSRVVNVASRNQQSIDFDDLRFDEGYQGGRAYGRSKLAQILHVKDLAEALGDRGILAYAVHPAPAMDTGLVRETGSTPQSTVEEGLEAVYRVATEGDLPNGAYFHELEQAPAHDDAYDEAIRRELREASERLVGS